MKHWELPLVQKKRCFQDPCLTWNISQQHCLGNCVHHDPLLACIFHTSFFCSLLILDPFNSFASLFGLDIIWWMYIYFIWNFSTKEWFKVILFLARMIFTRGSTRLDKLENKKSIPCSEFFAIWKRSSNLLHDSNIFFRIATSKGSLDFSSSRLPSSSKNSSL